MEARYRETKRTVMPNTARTRFVVDNKGRPVSAVVDIKDYRRMLEQLEELEDIAAYDRAKKAKGRTIPMAQAIAEIEKKRKK